MPCPSPDHTVRGESFTLHRREGNMNGPLIKSRQALRQAQGERIKSYLLLVDDNIYS